MISLILLFLWSFFGWDVNAFCHERSNLPHLPWIVFYGEKAPAGAFDTFNPVVLQATAHPPIQPLLRQGKEVLGYVALTQTETSDPWYVKTKEKGIFIAEDVNWKTSWTVDIRQPYWKQLFLDEIVPYVLTQGFTGLLMDQADVAIALEQNDPVKYKGMQAALIDLINAIHLKFPEARLMLNRGYEILPQVGHVIAYELAETLYSSYDFQTKKYYVRPHKEFEWQLGVLNHALASFPHLVLFSLDYWNPDDQAMYKKIYAIERDAGMRPCISTIELNWIQPDAHK